MATIYTVGHGARTTQELVGVLRGSAVGRLVDVRRFPGSKRHPHFAKERLMSSLREHGITYDWREALGGRRRSTNKDSRHVALHSDSFRSYADYMDTEAFRASLEQLESEAEEDPPLAIMCAETLWWRCHRRMIADALVLDGYDMVHLLDATMQQAHALHQNARADELGRPVYDVGAAPLAL